MFLILEWLISLVHLKLHILHSARSMPIITEQKYALVLINFVKLSRSTALWFRMRSFRSENKKMQNCANFEKNDIFHIFIHLGPLKSTI